MTDEPTDEALENLFVEETGFDIDDFPAAIFDFARAVLAKWGQPAGAGEVAERYRNAIASACEGWTMPDGLRKHLETALWSPPTPQPTQPQAGAVPLTGEQIQDLLLCGNPTDEEMRLIRIGWDAANGIKGGQHGDATPQPTQPVAREPLPKFLALKFHARRDKKATVTLLFPGHEAADAWVRGIKGGQHVS